MPNIKFKLGEFYFLKEDYINAEKYFLECVKYKINKSILYLVRIYFIIKQFDKIKEYFDIFIKELKHEPYFMSEFNYFLALFKQKKYELLYFSEICLSLKIKDKFIMDERQRLLNKLELSEFGECPICFCESKLVFFECFRHKYCMNCVYMIKCCAICKI